MLLKVVSARDATILHLMLNRYDIHFFFFLRLNNLCAFYFSPNWLSMSWDEDFFFSLTLLFILPKHRITKKHTFMCQAIRTEPNQKDKITSAPTLI